MNVQKQSLQEPESQKCLQCKLFWGTQAHQGLCSKCYSSHAKANLVKPSVPVETKEPVQTKSKEEVVPAKPLQQNKNKCFNCNKKLGLLGVQCKCGYVFCNNHRLPEDHHCSVNYEQQGKEELKNNLRKVSAGKIQDM